MHPLVFVQYIFEKAEHRVDVQCHGNSMEKSAKYYRTSHTTKEIITALCNQGKSPNVAFHEGVAEQGGITQMRNAACHLRNVRQVKHDQMLELIQMQKESASDADKAFVRRVETSSDPCVILANLMMSLDFVQNPQNFAS